MKLFCKVTLALLLSLLLWELVLEITIIKFPGSVNHPVMGRISRSGVYIQGTEGYCVTQINHLGFRGRNIPEKKTYEYRTMILGDSFTEAFQVAENKTFCHLIQERLRRISHKEHFKVVNIGKSGASPAAYIHLAEYYKKVVKPDCVIVQLNDGDFIRDIFDSSANFFVKNESNTYKTVFNNSISSKDFLNRIPQLTAIIKPLFSLSIVRIGFDNLKKMLAANTINPKNEVRKLSPNYEGVIAWSVIKLKEKYPDLIILYIPDLHEVDTTIEKQMKYQCTLNNVTFINMRKPFMNYVKKYHQPVNGFNNTTPGQGHLNVTGHQLVGIALTNYLKGTFQK